MLYTKYHQGHFNHSSPQEILGLKETSRRSSEKKGRRRDFEIQIRILVQIQYNKKRRASFHTFVTQVHSGRKSLKNYHFLFIFVSRNSSKANLTIKKIKTLRSALHTVRNLHFFVQKFNFDFP